MLGTASLVAQSVGDILNCLFYVFNTFCRPYLPMKSPPSLLLLLLLHFPWLIYFLLCFLVALVSLIPFHLFSLSLPPRSFPYLPLFGFRFGFHFLLPVHWRLSMLAAIWLPLSMLQKK